MNHSEIVSFLWGVADLIRDTFKRGKYQDVILPLTVLRRLDCVLADTKAEGDDERHRDYKAALVLNLILNAGWSFAFFKAKKLGLASIVAGALAASSADLSKRAGQQDPKLGLALKPYSAWTSFATALSTDIWRRNRD